MNNTIIEDRIRSLEKERGQLIIQNNILKRKIRRLDDAINELKDIKNKEINND